MIIRLTRAGIRPEREAEAFERLRQVSAGIGRPEGMEALYLGRRTEGRRVDLVAITVWRDMTALQAIVGRTWQTASFMPDLDPMLIDPTVEHFETLAEVFEDLPSLGLAPLEAS